MSLHQKEDRLEILNQIKQKSCLMQTFLSLLFECCYSPKMMPRALRITSSCTIVYANCPTTSSAVVTSTPCYSSKLSFCLFIVLKQSSCRIVAIRSRDPYPCAYAGSPEGPVIVCPGLIALPKFGVPSAFQLTFCAAVYRLPSQAPAEFDVAWYTFQISLPSGEVKNLQLQRSCQHRSHKGGKPTTQQHTHYVPSHNSHSPS